MVRQGQVNTHIRKIFLVQSYGEQQQIMNTACQFKFLILICYKSNAFTHLWSEDHLYDCYQQGYAFACITYVLYT